MEEIGKERRRFSRITSELFVRYKVLSIQKQQLDGKTRNISEGGICLVTREPVSPGALLAMDIKFPHSDKPVLAVGRAVWCTNSGLGPSPAGHQRFDNGIEFVEISDLDRQRIVDHVEPKQEKAKDEGWKIAIVKNLPK